MVWRSELKLQRQLDRPRTADLVERVEAAIRAAGAQKVRQRLRRAAVGGKLAVWSERESGTEIELTIPAAVAYAKPPIARQPASSGMET